MSSRQLADQGQIRMNRSIPVHCVACRIPPSRVVMKRVLNQALSFISPNRRQEESRTSSPPAKRSRSADVSAHLDAIERLQSRLLVIDKDCSREQLAVQRRFDLMKDPILTEREDEIAKIPNFWATAISNHPATDPEAAGRDREILGFLQSIDLEDNIDDNGSYTFTFNFDAKRNRFFPHSQLVRKVTILDDQTDVVEATHISWAPKKKPTHPKSFFAWFASTTGSGVGEEDFGEVLRRDLWQNPYPYYLNIAPTVGDKRGVAPLSEETSIEEEEQAS